jgi:hypothetical protein
LLETLFTPKNIFLIWGVNGGRRKNNSASRRFERNANFRQDIQTLPQDDKMI